MQRCLGVPNDQGEAAAAAGAAIRTHLGALLAAAARQRLEGRAAAAQADARAKRRFHLLGHPSHRKFDSATSNVRCVMIGSLADELIRHQDSHNGRARRGFVEELVTRTNGVVP